MDIRAHGEKVLEAAKRGQFMAAQHLAEVMRRMVSIQCQAGGEVQNKEPGKRYGPVHQHSRPGQPPFRESGRGQESIAAAQTKDGARIGVTDMGIGNMIGGNYMAGWDSTQGIRGARRPWLSRWIQYRGLTDRIILRHVITMTGGERRK